MPLFKEQVYNLGSLKMAISEEITLFGYKIACPGYVGGSMFIIWLENEQVKTARVDQ